MIGGILPHAFLLGEQRFYLVGTLGLRTASQINSSWLPIVSESAVNP
jgi:hypothetical protein